MGEITNEYQKMVKPFYEKNFFPTEVKSIREPVVKQAYNFQNAQIVGNPNSTPDVKLKFITISYKILENHNVQHSHY